MLCQFTHEICKYIRCPLWSERRQACRFVLCVDKLLGNEVPRPQLSGKESTILNLIAQGYSNKQIAHQLGIQESTAKNHVSNMLRKLGATSRLDALVKAAKSGILQLGNPEVTDED